MPSKCQSLVPDDVWQVWEGEGRTMVRLVRKSHSGRVQEAASSRHKIWESANFQRVYPVLGWTPFRWETPYLAKKKWSVALMVWIVQRSLTPTGSRCTFSACLAIFNTGANNIETNSKSRNVGALRYVFPECAQGVLWVALNCIDHVVVIWSKHCDSVAGPGENLTKWADYGIESSCLTKIKFLK